MHLQVVIAFALLLWWPQDGPVFRICTGSTATLIFVWGKLALFVAAGHLLSRHAVSSLARETSAFDSLARHHRIGSFLRIGVLVGLAADLFLTDWPIILETQEWLTAIPGGIQLTALIPYLLGIILIWWTLYPLERAGRSVFSQPCRWSRKRFIIFNIRHHVLVVAVPLSVILIVYAATRDHSKWLVDEFGPPWIPDGLVCLTAAMVFIISPVMLRYIWTTSPLPDGPLRKRLLELCAEMRLRVRDILVWHSDGVMVNAAVMGLMPRVRYIMLSDALLESMSDEEIEAVFGHEAGHVRLHHIQFFLFFALASMLVVAGIIELLVVGTHNGYWPYKLSQTTIQAIGVLAAVPIWAIAFGSVSRHFERQADVHGTGCVSPPADSQECNLPCARHDRLAGQKNAVCATGTRIFIGALRKVAMLNGIPLEERSWRHSSIASRIRFLTSLSGDPMMAGRFVRRVRWIKTALILGCVIGSALTFVYVWRHPVYKRQLLNSVIPSKQRVANPARLEPEG